MTRRQWIALASLLLMTGCSDVVAVAILLDSADPAAVARACGETPGTVQTGAAATWTRAGSPHRVSHELVLNQLTLEAGTVVCLDDDARIIARNITALGTPDLPIVFTAANPDARWRGLLIENGSVRHVRIEDPCRDASDCAGLGLSSYSAANVGHVVVRGSGDRGVAIGWRGHHVIGALRIEGSRNAGLATFPSDGDYGTTYFIGPVRITGGGSYPVHTKLRDAQQLLAVTDPDSLTGNAVDRIHVYAGIGGGSIRIGRSLAWHLHGYSAAPPLFDIAMEPGSALSVSGALRGRFHAEGTAAEPVRITGTHILFDGDGADTSVLRYVQLDSITLTATGSHALRLEHVAAARTRIQLRAPGSRISHAHFVAGPPHPLPLRPDAVLELGDGTRAEETRILGAAAHGILVTGSDVRIDGCAVTEAAGDGIRVGAGAGLVVRRCDLADNQGAQLRNLTATPVDARHNWWGRPAGPLASDVAGPVEWTPFLTASATTPLPRNAAAQR